SIVFNTRRQQVKETDHVTFDKSMQAIRFTNTSEDEIGIDDSSRYPSNEFIHEDDPSRQSQTDSDIPYYVIPHVPDLPQSHTSNQTYTSSHLVPQDRWSKDQHFELVKIIGDPGEGMLTRSMVAKLTITLASECLFVDFISKIEPKKENSPTFLDCKSSRMTKQSPFFKNRGMIGSLMYLTATRPDIQFSTVLCVRYQSNLKESNQTARKIILKYLKGTPTFGLYHLKCSGFNLKRYSDYDGCNMNKKHLGSCQILGGKLLFWSAKKQQSMAMSSAKAEYVAAARCCASIL
nr:uncharacterized mitochondrial protein AtMg00810-like [Tanacetum cinerariifolium]